MSKTNIEKISKLKKGDAVLVYSDDPRQKDLYYGIEYVVSSVRKDAIHVKDKYDRRYKFDECGYGDYGMCIFPGTKEELIELINYINNADASKKFMYVTPYLTEVQRIISACPTKNFQEPKEYDNYQNL